MEKPKPLGEKMRGEIGEEKLFPEGK